MRLVSVRLMSAILLLVVGAGISACVGGGPQDDDRPGGGFANTGRGFTYGRP